MDLGNLRMVLIDCSHNLLPKKDALQHLMDFEKHVRTQIRQSDRAAYLHENYEMLSAIKFEVDYVIKDPKNQPNNDLILVRDKLFGSLLKNVHIINERKRVTLIFTEFIQGITYFVNEQLYNQNQPAYHRLGSCSPRNQPNQVCNVTNAAPVTQKKKKEIRICYIERLVYDYIWTKYIFSSQDMDHIQWLEQTRAAYRTCFPDNNITIEIEFDDQDNIPLILKVYENDVYEIYEKRYDRTTHAYVNPVNCTKINQDGTKNRKQSTFGLDGVWRQVHSSQ